MASARVCESQRRARRVSSRQRPCALRLRLLRRRRHLHLCRLVRRRHVGGSSSSSNSGGRRLGWSVADRTAGHCEHRVATQRTHRHPARPRRRRRRRRLCPLHAAGPAQLLLEERCGLVEVDRRREELGRVDSARRVPRAALGLVLALLLDLLARKLLPDLKDLCRPHQRRRRERHGLCRRPARRRRCTYRRRPLLLLALLLCGSSAWAHVPWSDVSLPCWRTLWRLLWLWLLLLLFFGRSSRRGRSGWLLLLLLFCCFSCYFFFGCFFRLFLLLFLVLCRRRRRRRRWLFFLFRSSSLLVHLFFKKTEERLVFEQKKDTRVQAALLQSPRCGAPRFRQPFPSSKLFFKKSCVKGSRLRRLCRGEQCHGDQRRPVQCG